MSFVSCGNIPNVDHCTIAPPNGYPTFASANGILFMHSGSSNSLYALRSSDGKILWKYQAWTLLAVEQGIAYVEDTNDVFYALQASDGTVRWQYDMGKDTSSVITVDDGMVYLTSSTFSLLYTLRASDGMRLWQQKIDFDNHYPSTIIAEHGITYVAAGYAYITAYRESDGTLLWQDKVGNLPPGNPLKMTLRDGIVYATSDQTTALRASDGTTLWHFPAVGTLVTGNGVIYLNADNQQELYALQESDGSQIWHWQYPESNPSSRSGPGAYILTLANDVVYAGPGGDSLFTSPDTYSGHVYALNSRNGTLLWSQPLQQQHVTLQVANGMVFTLSKTGLDAWQANNGRQVWHASLQQVDMLIANGTIYAGTAGVSKGCFAPTQSRLTALNIINGSRLWQLQADTVQ